MKPDGLKIRNTINKNGAISSEISRQSLFEESFAKLSTIKQAFNKNMMINIF